MSHLQIFSIDFETMIFANSRKKPVISEADFFDGLYDGIVDHKKKIDKLNQCVMILRDNRVGVRGNGGDRRL